MRPVGMSVLLMASIFPSLKSQQVVAIVGLHGNIVEGGVAG
jgi:hypothetical protein